MQHAFDIQAWLAAPHRANYFAPETDRKCLPLLPCAGESEGAQKASHASPLGQVPASENLRGKNATKEECSMHHSEQMQHHKQASDTA